MRICVKRFSTQFSLTFSDIVFAGYKVGKDNMVCRPLILLIVFLCSLISNKEGKPVSPGSFSTLKYEESITADNAVKTDVERKDIQNDGGNYRREDKEMKGGDADGAANEIDIVFLKENCPSTDPVTSTLCGVITFDEIAAQVLSAQ